jgi:HSP20 family molecular chaperone IbpA
MSLIPHRFFPRSMFDMDSWFRNDNLWGPSTLDLFDPFDELDRLMSRNIRWLDVPQMLSESILPSRPNLPMIPQKHRIVVDVRGFNPNSITTEVKGDQLIVTGCEGQKPSDQGDYSVKEFKRTYKIPDNVDVSKLVSFVTGNGRFVVEIPYKLERLRESDDLFPRLIDEEGGKKRMEMHLSLPENIDPNKVNVTFKDRDLIVQAEDKQEKPDTVSRVYYYRRSTLPENTDFNALKCHLEKNKLTVTAPVTMSLKEGPRQIPIETGQQQAQQEQQRLR